MDEAQYVALVSRACPGMFNEYQVLWELPQERGWAYIHDYRISQGVVMNWPGQLEQGSHDSLDITALKAKYAGWGR